MVKYARLILSLGCSFLFSLAGLVLQLMWPSRVLMTALAVIAPLPLAAFAASAIFSRVFARKIRKTPVAEGQAYLLKHREEAEKTSAHLLKVLRGIRICTAVYAVLLWLSALAVSLLGGMLYTVSYGFFMAGIVYGGAIFYAVYSRIPTRSRSAEQTNDWTIPQEEYPRLYAIAARAAEKYACHGEIALHLSCDCNAGIVHKGERYDLQLGAILLGIMSEEELYAILLHEFSHAAVKHRRANREIGYHKWLYESRELPAMWLLRAFFSAFDVCYVFRYFLYEYAASVVKETEADRDMAAYGDPAVAATALLKLNYHDFFEWESGVKNEESLYAPEEPNPHFLRDRIARLREAILLRHGDWDEMLSCEILANNASHPTLRMRLETIGVARAEYRELPSGQEYCEEQERVLERADRLLREAVGETYNEDRKERYLEPLERVTAWEEAGCPLLPEAYADVISDLGQLGRHEEAEALCDRAIAELPHSSAMHAIFIKGCALLWRYDEAGLALVYDALENNSNYLEEGTQTIGKFLCMTGREAELAEYRARARQLAQKDVDEYRELGILSPRDTLVPDDMPQEMREEILAYIRSIDMDIIQNIYLCKKIISESFSASAFVIHFYGGTDAMQEEIMHKIFRYLDSYPVEWQFTLFDYFSCRQIKFDKIEGSLVFSKNKG